MAQKQPLTKVQFHSHLVKTRITSALMENAKTEKYIPLKVKNKELPNGLIFQIIATLKTIAS